MAIVEVMKGRLNVPEIDVVIDDRRLAVRAGGEWLLALPGAGTRFVPACGVYAVRVTGGSAVGQIESIGSDQRVPLERIRAFNRE